VVLNRDIAPEIITKVRQRAERLLSHPARRTQRRLTKERVSRISAGVTNARLAQPESVFRETAS